MSRRKNLRLVKVKTIIPSEYVKEILRFQALSLKSTRDSINSVGEMVNSLHEVHDSDSNVIITKLNSLEKVLEKVFLFFSIAFLVLFVIIFIS